MKYSMMMRSIPDSKVSMESKHTAFFEDLSQLAAPWGVHMNSPPELGKPEEFMNFVTLNNLFGPGTKCRIGYQNRKRQFEDIGQHDDHFVLEFDPEKVDYDSLVKVAFYKFVQAFDAYYAYVGNSKSVEADYAKRRKVDYRKGIVRFFPLNFLSSTLCNRAFGLPVEKLEKRLTPCVQKLKLANDGVFIIATEDLLDHKQSDDTNKRLLALFE